MIPENRSEIIIESDKAGPDPAPLADARASRPINGRIAVVRNIADVEIPDTKWVRYPYLPHGQITILDGDPASCKTWVAVKWAAEVTSGEVPSIDGIPEQPQEEPGDVLYFGEDSAEVIAPRFQACGGDISRLDMLDGVRASGPESDGDQDGLEPFTQEHLELLDSELAKKPYRLVIIDPLTAILGADFNVNVLASVRNLMMKFKRLAVRHDLVVLMTRHLRKSKSKGSSTLHHGLGSVDIIAAARSALIIGTPPGRPDERILAHHKNSLGPVGQSISFEIDEGKLVWIGASSLPASALGVCEARPPLDRKLDQAARYLALVLAHGPVPTETLKSDGGEYGFAFRTLERAKRELGIVSRKRGNAWIWARLDLDQLPLADLDAIRGEIDAAMGKTANPADATDGGDNDGDPHGNP